MNILAVCFQASPAKGSEFSVGWGWLRMIAADHSVTVITNDAERVVVEEAAANDELLRDVRFVFVPWNADLSGTSVWPFLRPFRYAQWRRRAMVEIVRLNRESPFDLCHYVNAVGFRDVLPLWKTGRPFVWGPVGGLSFVHSGLFRYLGVRSKLFYAVKNGLRALSIRFSRLPALAARKAATIIAATEQTKTAIQSRWGTDSKVVSEIGAKLVGKGSGITTRESGERLRVVWCGRVHSGKAPMLAVEAVAQLPGDVDWGFSLVGDGRDRTRIQSWIDRNDMSDRIEITGWLDRQDVQQRFASAHVFLLTSVQDLTSNVLVEALSHGVPIVCLSAQAAAEIVADRCGLVVDVEADDLAADICAAVATLFYDEDMRRELARNAFEVAGTFDWQAKREVLREIYQSAVES